MLGQMMHRPLSIIEILRFAAEIHKTAEIVSVRTSCSMNDCMRMHLLVSKVIRSFSHVMTLRSSTSDYRSCTRCVSSCHRAIRVTPCSVRTWALISASSASSACFCAMTRKRKSQRFCGKMVRLMKAFAWHCTHVMSSNHKLRLHIFIHGCEGSKRPNICTHH